MSISDKETARHPILPETVATKTPKIELTKEQLFQLQLQQKQAALKENGKVISKRLFIGGLPLDVSSEDLTARFSSFGTVSQVDIRSKPDQHQSYFAFLSLRTTVGSLKKCISIYHGTKWKGHALRIEESKQDYLSRD
ncbi:hypothetical protein BDEG_22996 [Batrachochytrium dendrobatidis JEL423]|uniref:RRM domain-containing protein n=1 Tax=Batrachochytrium dendrobatidis (strain JEL423) TaxID=403673 RepID=A0A177WGC9_BATDL|nr:hypothetical protein BDEG_22996 [Batrachochytrium dendrobatidis JEL423]